MVSYQTAQIVPILSDGVHEEMHQVVYQEMHEEVHEEVRCWPPAPGEESVEIPGELEREHREKSAGIVSIPKETWDQILDLHDSLNSSS